MNVEEIMKYMDKLDGISTSEWKKLKEIMDEKMGIEVAERISVERAAQIMGKSPQFIRLCLQDRSLPFGVANKRAGADKWSYYISPKLFYEYVGETKKNN